MLSKKSILKNSKNQTKKHTFILAWSRFLNYDELMEFDQPEVYDAEIVKGTIKSKDDWNMLVIPYTEDNVKKSLCISLNKAIDCLNIHENESNTLDSIYFDDIKVWLDILEDHSFDNMSDKTKNDIKEFYIKVFNKYKF